MIRKSILTTSPAIAAVLLAVPAAHAGDGPFDLSANVAITTDYVFRGLSQTDEDPALQGGFDAAHDSGLYAGVWGSNLDFNEGGDEQADLELDFYGGYEGDLGGGLGWTVGGIYYYYPGADDDLDFNFWEVNAGVSYEWVSLTYSYTPEFFGDTGDGHYVDLSGEVEIAEGFAASAHLGYQDVQKDDSDFGGYYDWSLGVSKDLAGFGFGLTYHDTDIDEPDDDIAEARVVFTVSKEF